MEHGPERVRRARRIAGLVAAVILAATVVGVVLAHYGAPLRAAALLQGVPATETLSSSQAQARANSFTQALAALSRRNELLRKIRAEAAKNGVGIDDIAADEQLSAAQKQQPQALSRQALMREIKAQQHVLTKIESLSGIEIDKIKKPRVHKFDPAERQEHYHNIFADTNDDVDPDAFAQQQHKDGDAAARSWHMDLHSVLSHSWAHDPAGTPTQSNGWKGEEDALSRLQAKAEARLKKDKLAHDDTASAKSANVVEDDSGEKVPSDSIAAVVPELLHHAALRQSGR